MLRGGQSDNLSFKEGGMTKRSMPPSFWCKGVRLLCTNMVQTNPTPLHQLFGHGVLGLAVEDELVYYGLQRHAADGVVGFLRAVGAMRRDDAARMRD